MGSARRLLVPFLTVLVLHVANSAEAPLPPIAPGNISNEAPLPPLAPIADTSEYLKLTPKLTNEEFQQFLARAEKGEPLAMDLVFFAWFSGYGTPCDFNHARMWLDKGNRVGAPVCRLYYGRNLLGYILDYSRRDPVQGRTCLKQAEAFFLPSANNGNAAAQFFVGAQRAMLQDNTALEWYEKSAAQGFPSAQLNLGLSLYYGNFGKKDVAVGIRLVRQAAEQDMVLAMDTLSDLYRRPESLDTTESLRWLKHGATNGNPLACRDLALAYMNGQGIKKDQAEAHRWLLKAAEAGFGEAMHLLANQYWDGTGTKADHEEALKWFHRGIALGVYGDFTSHAKQGMGFLAVRMLTEAERLARNKKTPQALEMSRKAREVASLEFGEKSANFATLLHKLGHVYQDVGCLQKAESFHEESVSLFEEIKATNELSYAEALMCTSHIEELAGHFSQAEARARTGLAVLKKKLPATHPYVLNGMTALAGVLRVQGRFLDALALLEEARAEKDVTTWPIRYQNEFWLISAKVNSELRRIPAAEEAARKCVALNARLPHGDEVLACNAFEVLSETLQLKGQYIEARTALANSLKLKEKHLGKEHFLLAEPLVSLGHLDEDFGKYDLAEEAFRRAVLLCANASAAPEIMASATQALASLLQTTGRFSEAEALYRQAFEWQQKAERSNWGIVNNYGNFLESIGKYDEADRCFRQALSAAEKEYGPDHPELLTPLSNLADLYGQLGRSTEQKELLDRRRSIAEKAHGTDHIDYAWVLLDLSYLARNEERYTDAIELLQRVLPVFKRCYGEQGFKVLEIESVIAGIQVECGDFKNAEPILRRVLANAEKIKGYIGIPELQRKLGLALQGLQRFEEAEKFFQEDVDGTRLIYGAEQTETAYALKRLAYLHAALGRSDEALRGLHTILQIEQRTVGQVCTFSSELQRVEFSQTQVWTGYALLTLCLEQMAVDASARSAAIDLLLRRQGAVLADVQRERIAAREAGNPALAETMSKRQRLAATLSHLTLAGPGNRDPKDYQAQLEDLRKQINELEADWARKSSAFREQSRQQTLAASDIQKVLPVDAAFVQIAAYRQKNFKEVAESKTWGPRQYTALILTKGSESPTLVKLGAADPIEKAIAACSDATQKMTKPGEKTAGDEWLKTAADVRRLVWDPLADALKDRRKVYLVPDGELNFVAFGTLPLENGKFLLEEREIALLSNGRDLLRESVASKEGTVLALAAPEFGGIATAQEEVAFARGLFRSHLAGRAGFDRLGAFNPLPGTLAEARSIEALCKTHARKVEVYTGAEATEARLKSAARPTVLHLATHGFFLPEPDDAKKNDSAVRNALLRSGLALAGANRIVKGEAPPADQEDGLVTAEEITGLDLWGTKLVVLSACQTALGESRGGEGVFGLRRAFLLAGAEHLVMSLWSVPDKETQELMTEFYKRHLGGASPGRALREAQLEYLRRAKAENRSTHPFYWGAFVHTGIGVE